MKTEFFFAKTFQGLEEILAQELKDLGADSCEIALRGVKFSGDYSLLYKTNYFSRFSLRILWQIKKFRFRNNKNFYKEIFDIEIDKYLTVDSTFAVSADASNSIFNTPLFASLLAKDAICDYFRSKYDRRPNVDKEKPDVQFHLFIQGNEATLFLDSSGESLHKREYKIANHPAPINEVLAAAMIQLSGWKQNMPIIDLMCGSGTILIEAAMMALNIPAGFYRSHYGFFGWNNFEEKEWNKIVNSAVIKEDIPFNFYGSDISSRFLDYAKRNIQEARLEDFIILKEQDFADSQAPQVPSLLILNPPYGERLNVQDLQLLYKKMGDIFKQKYQGCTAWIISSDIDALKSIGLHPSKKLSLYNAKLACKFLQFELY